MMSKFNDICRPLVLISRCRFAAPIEPEHRANLIRSLASWEFKPHLLSEVELFHCACLLFEAVLSIHGLKELDIGSGELMRIDLD